MAKKRISELKTELERKRKGDLKTKQMSEKLGLDRAHLDEFNQFNEFWDKKMIEFEAEARRIEVELLERE